MYSDELPEFRKVKHSYVTQLINGIFIGAGGASFVKLETFDDNHFRVIFRLSYFQLAEGNDMPSKSQWNTLKKRIKRRNHSIFVFREYGEIDCKPSQKSEDKTSETCLYLDFGFLYD